MTGGQTDETKIVGYLIGTSPANPSDLICEPRPAACVPNPPPCPFSTPGPGPGNGNGDTEIPN